MARCTPDAGKRRSSRPRGRSIWCRLPLSRHNRPYDDGQPTESVAALPVLAEGFTATLRLTFREEVLNDDLSGLPLSLAQPDEKQSSGEMADW